MTRTELTVGEQERGRAGFAIATSLTLAAIFVACTWSSKETPGLNLHQPWQDDPYDVLVSLDFVILPVLVVTGALRVQLCRRYAALPARRLVDLLRICGAALGVCLATELAEWVAVALGLHSPAWTVATAWQVAALALLTLATIGALLLLRHAARRVIRVAQPSAQPDWLADAVTIGLRISQSLGRQSDRTQTLVRWIDLRAIARVRSHPVAAAALLACALALPFVMVKVVVEGYPPALVLLAFSLPAASLFAFVVIVGRYLRIVAPDRAEPPVWLCAIVVACAAGTVAFAFHDSLLTHQTAAGLDALLFGGGLVGGVATFTMLVVLRHFRPLRNNG
jgi:hypothetical protein